MELHLDPQAMTPPNSSRNSSLDESGRVSPHTVIQLSDKLGAQSLSSGLSDGDASEIFPADVRRLPTPAPDGDDAESPHCSIAFNSPFGGHNDHAAPPTVASTASSSRKASVQKSRPSSINMSVAPHAPNSYPRSNVRAIRQRALRNQCSNAHLRAIQDLVARMMQNEELCSVSSRPLSSSSNQSMQPASESRGSEQETPADQEQSRRPSSTDEVEERDVVMADDEMIAVLPEEPFDDEAMVLENDSDLDERNDAASPGSGFKRLKYRRSMDWCSEWGAGAGTSRCIVRKNVRLRKRIDGVGVRRVAAAVV